MPNSFLFTSESVNEGHPDKLSDQISDAVLDHCLKQDPNSRVACETCCKNEMVMVFGEVTTKAQIDYDKIVRDCVRDVGYDDEAKGLDFRTMDVINRVDEQSPEIGQAVHGLGTFDKKDLKAGDQGHMFGYATDETEDLMPITHSLATALGRKLTEVRKNGVCPWVLPDGKTQLTIEYEKREDGSLRPIRIHTCLISTQHTAEVTQDQIQSDLLEHVIRPVLPKNLVDEDTIYHLNPSGRFVVGGPHADAGLTGRKIIVDTYGGWGAHGGGAFSGKDCTKVDRSAAYMARHVAKSLVGSGLCARALVQVSYSIGVADPLSLFVDTFGSAKLGLKDEDLTEIVKQNFDFRPGSIIESLDLQRPQFRDLAVYGHFGRPDLKVAWEEIKNLSHN